MKRVSRRDLLRAGVLGGASVTLNPATGRAATTRTAKASSGATYQFNQGWRFGGVYGDGSQEPGYPDRSYPLVTLPGNPGAGSGRGSTASTFRAPR
jgi:hypothetical protein